MKKILSHLYKKWTWTTYSVLIVPSFCHKRSVLRTRLQLLRYQLSNSSHQLTKPRLQKLQGNHENIEGTRILLILLVNKQISPFLEFCKEQSKIDKLNGISRPNHEVTMVYSKKWQSLTPDQRKAYLVKTKERHGN